MLSLVGVLTATKTQKKKRAFCSSQEIAVNDVTMAYSSRVDVAAKTDSLPVWTQRHNGHLCDLRPTALIQPHFRVEIVRHSRFVFLF
jgi:hypothetical protein